MVSVLRCFICHTAQPVHLHYANENLNQLVLDAWSQILENYYKVE